MLIPVARGRWSNLFHYFLICSALLVFVSLSRTGRVYLMGFLRLKSIWQSQWSWFSASTWHVRWNCSMTMNLHFVTTFFFGVLPSLEAESIRRACTAPTSSSTRTCGVRREQGVSMEDVGYGGEGDACVACQICLYGICIWYKNSWGG